MVGMVVAGMAGSYGREAARNRRNGGNGVGGGKRERKRKGGIYRSNPLHCNTRHFCRPTFE
jgi:hypothetical protein